jgi:hypothetical protein
MAVEMGKGEASPVKLIINQGKSPMVASSLENSLNSIIDSSSLAIQKEFINPVSGNLGLLASFLPMVFMILIYISSYASAVIIRRSFNLNNKNRGLTILIQLGMSAVIALCICFIATPIVGSMIDLDISLVDMALFMSLASFALITIVIGSLNWFGMVGMAVPILLLVLGLGTADLPYEFLPGFWQSMVYPWMPLRFIADGARAILYQGAGFWNISFGALAIVAAVGIFIMSTSIITPLHKLNKTA